MTEEHSNGNTTLKTVDNIGCVQAMIKNTHITIPKTVWGVYQTTV